MKCVYFLIAVICFASQSFAQSFAHPGIELYLAGKNSEAITSLAQAVKQNEFKNNGEVWNYLGLAYTKGNDYKNARKALEKAVRLPPANSTYYSNLTYVYLMSRQSGKARSAANKAIELNPNNVGAYYLRGVASYREQRLSEAEKDAKQAIALDSAYAQAYVLSSSISLAKLEKVVSKGAEVKDNITLLKDAADILKVGIEKCKGSPNAKLVEDEFKSIEAFHNYFANEKPPPTFSKALPEPGVTPIKILSKPRPQYTDSARQANVQGTILLAVLFGANGEIEHVLLLKRLGSGLDEEAVKAARKIKFEPMMKDGRPVPVVKMIEMGFAIY